MIQRNTRILKFATVICLAWLAVSVTHDWLTAESRFYAKLDDELWKLRQPGVDRVLLPPHERARYHALLRCNDRPSRWRAASDLARWRDGTFVPALVAAMQDEAGTRRLLLHRSAIGEEVARALSASGNKENRWLAKYIQVIETDRQNADALARSYIITHSSISALSP